MPTIVVDHKIFVDALINLKIDWTKSFQATCWNPPKQPAPCHPVQWVEPLFSWLYPKQLLRPLCQHAERLSLWQMTHHPQTWFYQARMVNKEERRWREGIICWYFSNLGNLDLQGIFPHLTQSHWTLSPISSPENDVCIVEETIFVWHNEELALREVLLDHAANILAVVEVQRWIHFIQNVQRGRLEPACSTFPSHRLLAYFSRDMCLRLILSSGMYASNLPDYPMLPWTNLHNASISDRASKDRCPPDSSVRDSFHTSPKATRISKPAINRKIKFNGEREREIHHCKPAGS